MYLNNFLASIWADFGSYDDTLRIKTLASNGSNCFKFLFVDDKIAIEKAACCALAMTKKFSGFQTCYANHPATVPVFLAF